MSTPTRIYVVTGRADDSQRLVRASSAAQAIRLVVRDDYSAVVASQETIVELMSGGARVHDATLRQVSES